MFGKKPSSSDQNLPVVSSEVSDVAPHEGSEAVVAQTPHHQAVVDTSSPLDMVSLEKQAKDAVLNYRDGALETQDFVQGKRRLIEMLIEKVDMAHLNGMEEKTRRTRIYEVCDGLIQQLAIPLNSQQVGILKEKAVDEILGFGPLEPLLNDSDVSDIMVNGANQVYIEKQGKIYLTDIAFSNETHLLAIIQRIVTRVGRRVDESTPMVDARMPDGSRFNAIIPPLALNGSLVSIRKFKESKMPLSTYVDLESMSKEMAEFLAICGSIRLNMMVSGGTGSGKTTLLNALSGHIGPRERVITIEDAAELQLHQPHVLRLETRPPSIEGKGEVSQRLLVKNALRMRPDRIILGEIRGDEIIDLLTAMNTGHDGSMSTIHSNSPRDCLARIESLVNMSGVDVPEASLRYQISSALNIIVQIQRMRDGSRRVTHIEEVVGTEGQVISMQTLFRFRQTGMNEEGKIQGVYEASGVMPRCLERAEYYGQSDAMMKTLRTGAAQ